MMTALPDLVEIDNEINLAVVNETHQDALEALISLTDVQQFVPWAKEAAARATPDKAASKMINEFMEQRSTTGPRYAIEVDGQFAGLFEVFESIEKRSVEFGYMLMPEFRGNKIIDRVVEVMKPAVSQALPKIRQILCIDDTNEHSIKLAERLGAADTETFSLGDRIFSL